MKQDPLIPTPEAVAEGDRLMVVVNQSKWPSDFLEHQMYCAPTEGHAWRSSYRHVPARYIGNYVNRSVRTVGVVAACVHLRLPGPHTVLWNYGELDDAEAIVRAERVRSETRRHPRPCIVLLQSDLTETNFPEEMPEAFRASRQFFDLALLEPTDVKDLAQKLRSEFWSTMLKRTI